MNIIEVRNLSHRFGDGTFGVENINLSIQKGTFTILAGPNGSGKTTLCLHFNGLLKPTSGEILLHGSSISKNLRLARQKVGMVFQNSDSQIVGETVYADVAFGPENLCLSKGDINGRVLDALRIVGMDTKLEQNPFTLSAGEKRRLSIAGVLAMKPEFLIFDEPFSNLDFPSSTEVLEQILELHRAGQTILIIAHDLEKVVHHAGRLIVMSAGNIVLDGLPSQIIASVEDFGVEKPCNCRSTGGSNAWLS